MALCRDAFENGSLTALNEVNRILHKTYNAYYQLPIDFAALRRLDHPAALHAFRIIERSWAKNEERKAAITLDKHQCPDADLKPRIFDLVASHKASHHPLFDFLQHNASWSQFVSLFGFDYSLNMRFFDLVSLALPGLTGTAKQEVLKNLCDEGGNGNSYNEHTSMYERIISVLLPQFDRDDWIQRSGVEAFAGSNLFWYLGINRVNFYKYLGCMAATEILDPPQYDKLILGAKRIGLEKQVDLAYYSEHATVDIAHAAGWLDNVMVPLARDSGKAAAEMLTGVAMRLNTCADYYDMLLKKLNEPHT